MKGREISLEDIYEEIVNLKTEIQQIRGIVSAIQMDVAMIKIRPYIEDYNNPKWYTKTSDDVSTNKTGTLNNAIDYEFGHQGHSIADIIDNISKMYKNESEI